MGSPGNAPRIIAELGAEIAEEVEILPAPLAIPPVFIEASCMPNTVPGTGRAPRSGGHSPDFSDLSLLLGAELTPEQP